MTVYVLLELDAIGEEDICMHVLKLSDETWSVPEQVVSVVLVETLEELISSENVTEIEESLGIDRT